MASLPAAYYALDVSQSDPKHGETWGKNNVLKKPTASFSSGTKTPSPMPAEL